MSNERNKYLNAVNVLASGKIGALQKIYDAFDGDFKRAWHSNLSRFLPSDAAEQKTVDPDKEWKKIEKEKIRLVTILDNEYPDLLKHISDPPFLLYIKGTLASAKNPCFGVVGTRAISEYGKRATPHLVKDIANAGFVIVSGLAAGVDTLAHKTAIEVGQQTIAVLGCGVDDATMFPVQNLGLAHQIVEHGGAVISEYSPGAHGTLFSFPMRNRIISGLSKGVLVIEADEQSGALITAHAAVDQNRDVFAIPGSIFAKTSKGTNNILKKGAKLVTCSEDILEEYDLKPISNDKFPMTKRDIHAANELEEKILAVLTDEPMTANDIIRLTEIDAPQANATLMIMGLNKKIKDLGNGRFVSL